MPASLALAQTSQKRGRGAAKKLHASTAEARDEGPRLIPLDAKHSDKASRLEYYLQLADAAPKLQRDKAKTITE